MPSDTGPGHTGYARPIVHPDPGVPDDVNPASPSRNLVFLQFNGKQDILPTGPATSDCTVCFQLGKDIVVPIHEINACGPLCGYTMETLRQRAMWSPARVGEVDELINAPRNYTLMFAGHIPDAQPHDYTGRGGVYVHYRNQSGYKIVKTGTDPAVNMSEAMLASDFCFAPLGSSGGMPDRYVAAALFGCVPVMLSSAHSPRSFPMALPLEEVLHWPAFATVANVSRLEALGEQLRCLAPQLPRLRARLRHAWRKLVYSSIYQPYLGENPRFDAFKTLLAVLAQRARHNYTAPATVMARMAEREAHFPCLARPGAAGGG